MRSRELFDKSKPIDDRLEQLELVASRLARRTNTGKSAMITPYPISSATFGEDVRGPVLRYMFPCDGVVSKGMLRFSRKPKIPVPINIDITNEETSQARGYIVEKQQIIVKPDLAVKAGDCLTIYISPDEQEKVTEVWISFLWIPSVSDVVTKSFLIEELDNVMLEEGN